MNIIGKPTQDISARDKVTGRAKFTDDLEIKNPLIIKILRSPHPAAILNSVDLSEALKIKGVHAAISGEDFKNKFSLLFKFRLQNRKNFNSLFLHLLKPLPAFL